MYVIIVHYITSETVACVGWDQKDTGDILDYGG